MHGQKSDHLLIRSYPDEDVFILVVEQIGKFFAHERFRSGISQLGEQATDCERGRRRAPLAAVRRAPAGAPALLPAQARAVAELEVGGR